DQPVIGQRTIENEIRLQEGEINIMGGIFQETEIKSWSGLPGLGRIPLFRHLFATENTDHSVNEILFVLIPRIVRRLEVTPFNEQAIDVGKKDTTELRENSATQQAPAQQPPAHQQPVQQH
ncbi:MAG TPA: hypothetical protein VK699_02135, partial [Terriglobales bacterium]|nr:hypothetical protein [Terriglobales bacterium]